MFHLNKKLAKTGKIYKRSATRITQHLVAPSNVEVLLKKESILLSVDKYYVQKLCQCVQMWDSSISSIQRKMYLWWFLMHC